VIEWFAERADRILLLFDAHKLDISDEFKSAIESLRGHDDKIRVVLNKADLPMQHLMRVYGALMWSLGKVIKTPEVLRVYIGSFWDGPLKETDNAKLLQAEQADLLADLRALPRGSTVRKINELVKRARMAKVHAHLLNHIRSKFGMFGKKKDQAKMLEDANLAEIFRTVQQTCNLPQGDFPNMRRFREQAERYELWKLPKLEKKLLAQMDDVLSRDIPALMRLLPQEDAAKFAAHLRESQMDVNPFAEDPDFEQVASGWAITTAMKKRYDNDFYALDLAEGERATGAACKKVFLKSKLDPKQLRIVWDLADIDRDGALDSGGQRSSTRTLHCNARNRRGWIARVDCRLAGRLNAPSLLFSSVLSFCCAQSSPLRCT
jgi:EH domain-containing protein 1